MIKSRAAIVSPRSKNRTCCDGPQKKRVRFSRHLVASSLPPPIHFPYTVFVPCPVRCAAGVDNRLAPIPIPQADEDLHEKSNRTAQDNF
jgi:hypothetical protein